MMFKKITFDLLEDLTRPPVLFRGEDYYQSGAAGKIKYLKDKDSLTAAVRGRRTYAVTIADVSKNPQFFCTCPYDGMGICKHCAAVGLKVINEPNSVDIEETIEPVKDVSVDIESLMKKAAASQKENFLKEILKKNNAYRERFQTLVLGQTAVESETSVEAIRDDVKNEIEDFDLLNYERFYDDYNPNQGWKDEGEILYDAASEELNDMLEDYENSIKDHLHAGNIVEASKELLGFYEGISLVDENKIEDEIEIFPDGVSGELSYELSDFLKEFVELFRVVDKSGDALMRISEIVVQRVRYYQQNTDRYNDFKYDLTGFKPILKELVCCTKTARYWDAALEELGLKDDSTDEVQLKIADVLGNKDNWLQIAEKNFKSNPVVTKNLLDFYRERGDHNNFIRVGKFALSEWGNEFDQYLYENLEKEEDPDFFNNILSHYAEREKSIPLFNEYKEIFGQNAAKHFIEKMKGEWRQRFYYIRLLEEEKDYPAILAYVRENIHSGDFVEFIKPVIHVYPAECFKIIRKRTNDFLEQNVGRKYYYHAAQWLKLLLKIEDKELGEEIRRYFNALFTAYNRRPALKDELIKVGIKPTY